MHNLFAVYNCAAPTILVKHGTLHAMTAWVNRPKQRGQCWQIILWKIR